MLLLLMLLPLCHRFTLESLLKGGLFTTWPSFDEPYLEPLTPPYVSPTAWENLSRIVLVRYDTPSLRDS